MFHAWGMTVGWGSKNLPANEFREAQTALSTYWIDRDNDFSPAYPTPILGKPWSIPMEFPLYQWTTVIVSRTTHWSLTKAGRAVGIACFYLTLPALFLLLARWNVAPSRRWLVLALVLTCPFYVFFARAVLIETMALMFSVWFWVAFERAVTGRNRWWLIVAILTGVGAGLVKVTTYMLYLIPAGWWAFARLWRTRRTTWRTEFGWMGAASALPFAATLWWLHFADAVKARNVLGAMLTSDALTDFNLGTTATRFSGAMWLTKLHIVGHELSWLPGMLGCGLVALGLRRRGREIGACLLWFTVPLALFPVLYTLHVYYYSANTLLLLVAMGLALVALAESRASRWLTVGCVLLVAGGQVCRYFDHFFPSQRAVSDGESGLTRLLQTVVHPAEAIVVAGQDWNSTTAYYARRRAVMLRDNVVDNPAWVGRALAALGDTRIGALVIQGEQRRDSDLIQLCAERGIDPRPVCTWRNVRVYVRRERREEAAVAQLTQLFADVRLSPDVPIPSHPLAGRWVRFADLYPWERIPFLGMSPRPVRFFSQFGPAADGSSGRLLYGAHPVTRLVFALPAGHHVLTSTLEMKIDAYRSDLADADATDGVEVTLRIGADPASPGPLLGRRYFDPRHVQADRGEGRPLSFEFDLEEASEVELAFTPGPANNLTRDWIQLGELRIE